MLDTLQRLTQTEDGVFAIDSSDRIILWNHSAEKMLGFKSDEVLGKFCYEILPGKDPAVNLFCFKGCSVMTMARGGQLVRNYDVQMMAKNGSKGLFNVSIILISFYEKDSPIIVHLFRSVPKPDQPACLANDIALKVVQAMQLDGGAGPESPDVSAREMPSSLTKREAEILILMARCVDTREMADQLCISHATVRTHIQRVLEKLKVHSRLEAVALAFRLGLV